MQREERQGVSPLKVLPFEKGCCGGDYFQKITGNTLTMKNKNRWRNKTLLICCGVKNKNSDLIGAFAENFVLDTCYAKN